MNKKSTKILLLLPLFINLLIFTACSRKKTQIHLHDRHGLSYELVKDFALENGPLTLVLLDYHHDILPEIDVLTSVNWVGKLIEENKVKEVIWLSGKKLLLPNRNARMACLDRSLKNTYPASADKIRNSVTLVDWYDLQKLKLKGPFVITLDMDVFTKDPGEDVELFVKQLCSWTQKQKPELLTISLSAAYQPEPQRAWSWLELFVNNYKAEADWFLESGIFGEKEESYDELRAHELWRQQPQLYMSAKAAFYTGAYLWQQAPDYLVRSLLKKNIFPGNNAAKEIIEGWQIEAKETLEKSFYDEKQLEFSLLAKESMRAFFEGESFEAPSQNAKEESFGVAVRLRNMEEDRGCLSLYSGIKYEDIAAAIQYCTQEALVDPRYPWIQAEEAPALFTNISIFSDWEEMSSAYDFVPGLHSLLLETGDGEKTLLQTAIALERNYTREEFLSRLSNKAGLGFDGWRNENLKFYKSASITWTSK